MIFLCLLDEIYTTIGGFMKGVRKIAIWVRELIALIPNLHFTYSPVSPRLVILQTQARKVFEK